MLIRIPTRHAIRPSEITPEGVYVRRRLFLRTSLVGAAGLMASGCTGAEEETAVLEAPGSGSPWSTTEKPTSYKSITTYNNFYELGTSKSAPSRNADDLITRPWTVVVEGECENPGTFGIDELLKAYTLEERIYRLRCVEGWSMVIPWQGFPLNALLKRVRPTSAARYVAFETLYDPEMLPGQRRRVLDWPYREGLRMDEAMHPLTLMATGLYGKTLPNQNGAPLRLVVPWKYGFKSIKSIVRIRMQSREPETSWNLAAPDEYGFYSNVNPDVAHPRWSQKRERRIGEFLKRDTLPFNGYADQVASLYTGMDLRKHY